MLKLYLPVRTAVYSGWLSLVVVLLTACSVIDSRIDGPPLQPVDVSTIPDAVPRYEPRSRYGNPESYVVNGERYHVLNTSSGYVERGIASWYGRKFHDRRTSSGETYNMYAMTAAHRTLPLPTFLEVRNLSNGNRVIVRVNDRGPFHVNRIIDLSYAAALKLGIVKDGTGLVEIRAIDPGNYHPEIVQVKSEENKKTNGFYLQVGSFSNYDNALKLRNRLSGLADNLINISEVTVGDRKLYRVRFGPITDIDIADRLVVNLNHIGISENNILIDL